MFCVLRVLCLNMLQFHLESLNMASVVCLSAIVCSNLQVESTANAFALTGAILACEPHACVQKIKVQTVVKFLPSSLI